MIVVTTRGIRVTVNVTITTSAQKAALQFRNSAATQATNVEIRGPKGVMFGQNLFVVVGAGEALKVGDELGTTQCQLETDANPT